MKNFQEGTRVSDSERAVSIAEMIMSLTDEEVDQLFEDFIVSAVMRITVESRQV